MIQLICHITLAHYARCRLVPCPLNNVCAKGKMQACLASPNLLHKSFGTSCLKYAQLNQPHLNGVHPNRCKILRHNFCDLAHVTQLNGKVLRGTALTVTFCRELSPSPSDFLRLSKLFPYNKHSWDENMSTIISWGAGPAAFRCILLFNVIWTVLRNGHRPGPLTAIL